MAIETRSSKPGNVIHPDHGTVFTSWVFTQCAKDAGLLPSMGAVGSCCDNSMIESFWGRMRTEFLNRKAWRTHLELSNVIFEYPVRSHGQRLRHSMLGMRSRVEYEKLYEGTELSHSGFKTSDSETPRDVHQPR